MVASCMQSLICLLALQRLLCHNRAQVCNHLQQEDNCIVGNLKAPWVHYIVSYGSLEVDEVLSRSAHHLPNKPNIQNIHPTIFLNILNIQFRAFSFRFDYS